MTHTRLEDHHNSYSMFMLAISTDVNVLIIWLKATYVSPKDLRFDANCYYKKKFGNALIGYELSSILLGRVCSCTNHVFRIVFSSYPSNSVSFEPGMDCTLIVMTILSDHESQ